MKKYLSKSSFVKGIICQKALFYKVFNPALAEEISPTTQHLIDVGDMVDQLARTMYPGGTDYSLDRISAVRNTAIDLAFGARILYQASFKSKSGYCRTDILLNSPKERVLLEVKSTTSVFPIHIVDAAFQYLIMKEAGYAPAKVYIVCLNNKYQLKGELNISELFCKIDVTDDVLAIQKDIKEGVAKINDMLATGIKPNMGIGIYCDDPYPCEFRKHCWKNIGKDSIFEIARLTKKKKFELYNDGIVKLEDIPGHARLNENQRMQVDFTLGKKLLINKPVIKSFIENLKYPLYFLDFETIQHAIPKFQGTKPYQQITFQYSLHIQKESHEGVSHEAFLGDPAHDYRKQLIKDLIKQTKGKGTVLTYNKTFEICRLNEMAEQFPEYASAIKKIVDRIEDLMVLFRDRHYYHHEMRGSYSIKKVLPVLVPELSYQSLDIQEGASASLAFEKSSKGTSEENESLRSQLLEYCKMDTYAMVRIVEKLKNVVL